MLGNILTLAWHTIATIYLCIVWQERFWTVWLLVYHDVGLFTLELIEAFHLHRSGRLRVILPSSSKKLVKLVEVRLEVILLGLRVAHLYVHHMIFDPLLTWTCLLLLEILAIVCQVLRSQLFKLLLILLIVQVVKLTSVCTWITT